MKNYFCNTLYKNTVLIFSLLLFFCGYLYSNNNLAGQDFPIKSQGDLIFTADINTFRAFIGKTKLEIYYIIKLKDLQFQTVNNTLKASFSTRLTITDSTDQKIVSKEIINSTIAHSRIEMMQENKVVINQINQYLSPGKYQIQLQINDLNSKKSGSCDISTRIVSYDSNVLSISGIQLASAIKVDTSTNKFVKNNNYVKPNPARQFIFSRSNLNFYFEIYNLVPNDSEFANTFTLSYAIRDTNGNSLIDYPSKNIKKPGDSCVKVQAIDIKDFETGDYQLVVTVQDNFSNQEISAIKKFAIYQPELTNWILPMTKEDIKNYRNQIKYFATHQQLDLFDRLSPKGKEQFLLDFWRSKDTTPETPANEFLQDCFSRIHYANNNFKGKDDGLNSDMGRIFVIYGQPDDIENHTMGMDSKAYEIWSYFTTGSGKQSFVFVDRNNTGIYYLVHSTVEGEIKNPGWEQQELR